ncbi:hypothetical protein DERF_015956 [Dermatophagoides farinae]|uniref:Neurotransmitter-gated ion-channel ligand-binding domain-containing protein n=1 Tax=Dermatophagoides farinae TaxID=6954 RepID=A0A922HKV5_DERFA|nr:hypothetical protein DERF_015956 [Dermatophagoides farinae]
MLMIVFVLLSLTIVVDANNNIVENLFNKNDLNELKTVRPKFKTSEPIIVNASIYVMDIGLISTTNSMDFMIDFYFRQKWNDPRLAFIQNDVDNDNEYIVLSSNQTELIWRPDTFISTAKQIDEHVQKSFSNNGNRFVRINRNGDVFYSHRLSAIVNCANRINYFPSDRPVCVMKFESYGYSTKDIEYGWIKDGAQITLAPKSLIGFKIIKNNDNNGIESDDEWITLSTGTYSRLIARIQLQRKCGYYMFHIYLPAIMLVILSWMSYCIDPIERPIARMIVGIFTSLGILILMFGVTSSSISRPDQYSLTALDIYIFVCMLLIFIAFISAVSSCPNNESGKSYQLEQGQIVRQNSMHRYTRIVLPIVFILFNLSYWLTLWLANK